MLCGPLWGPEPFALGVGTPPKAMDNRRRPPFAKRRPRLSGNRDLYPRGGGSWHKAWVSERGGGGSEVRGQWITKKKSVYLKSTSNFGPL